MASNHITRPASTPTLVFERFKVEGNTEGAVVYFPKKRLLLHSGRHYGGSPYISDESKILDVFQYNGNNSLILNIDHPNFFNGPQQYNCGYVAIPDDEQQAKLTVLYQKHGGAMAEVAEQLIVDFKRVKCMLSSLKTEVNAICPGFDPRGCYHSIFQDNGDYPLDEPDNFDDMQSSAEVMLEGAMLLAKAQPFSKKRKSSDE